MPPSALPVGFRDGVMRRVAAERRSLWEWLVAALLAFPSLGFLARQLSDNGGDFVTAVANVVSAASSESASASFFIDGLTVLAVAILGIACVFAAHALLTSVDDRRRLAR